MGDIRMADLERTIDALEATLAAGDRDGMC
jgi:hypothetical protein